MRRCWDFAESFREWLRWPKWAMRTRWGMPWCGTFGLGLLKTIVSMSFVHPKLLLWRSSQETRWGFEIWVDSSNSKHFNRTGAGWEVLTFQLVGSQEDHTPSLLCLFRLLLLLLTWSCSKLFKVSPSSQSSNTCRTEEFSRFFVSRRYWRASIWNLSRFAIWFVSIVLIGLISLRARLAVCWLVPGGPPAAAWAARKCFKDRHKIGEDSERISCLHVVLTQKDNDEQCPQKQMRWCCYEEMSASQMLNHGSQMIVWAALLERYHHFCWEGVFIGLKTQPPIRQHSSRSNSTYSVCFCSKEAGESANSAGDLGIWTKCMKEQSNCLWTKTQQAFGGEKTLQVFLLVSHFTDSEISLARACLSFPFASAWFFLFFQVL